MKSAVICKTVNVGICQQSVQEHILVSTKLQENENIFLVEGVSFTRTVPTYFKRGEPNLILVPRGKNKLSRFFVSWGRLNVEYFMCRI